MIASLVDPRAERVVAGCAVATHEGATLANDRLAPGDFHEPWLAQLVTTAATLPANPEPTDPLEFPDDARARLAAHATGRPYTDIWHLVHNRPCYVDTNGYWAGRVLDAADRRRQAARLIDGLEHLGLNVYIAP